MPVPLIKFFYLLLWIDCCHGVVFCQPWTLVVGESAVAADAVVNCCSHLLYSLVVLFERWMIQPPYHLEHKDECTIQGFFEKSMA